MTSFDAAKQPSADGVVTRPSPLSFDATLQRLQSLIEQKGLKLFVLVDHSGEATKADLSMNERSCSSSDARPRARRSWLPLR